VNKAEPLCDPWKKQLESRVPRARYQSQTGSSKFMKIRKSHIAAVAAVAFAAIANPQTATSQANSAKTQAAPASTSSGSAASAQVETWTKKQWAAAQKEWAKDKARWSNCQKQSGNKHLVGRKSWSFLYTCMVG
jgi:hypothetical protein